MLKFNDEYIDLGQWKSGPIHREFAIADRLYEVSMGIGFRRKWDAVIHGKAGVEASEQFDKIDDAKAWLNAQAVRVAA
ncbi:hypothetical protein UFOVP399_3 [uncultured Caudovirales phage]|uniref:Uncharacterized protein n=1 Tax=uncultured Caudovirales phage TaxID=2100421 RepID=A0A6J5M2A5_9CAUD|nr:hypothetical protein UFOVP399_3 [uncultured Caudovirales phage]